MATTTHEITINDEETYRFATELASVTGESVDAAVRSAVRERLYRLRPRKTGAEFAAEIRRISDRISSLPVLDARTPDEILGYDENGLPG